MKKVLLIMLALLLCGCEGNTHTSGTTQEPASEPTAEITEPLTDAPHIHTPVIDAAVEPTCIAEGLTEGSHCAECGEILTDQAPIERTEHKAAPTAATAPTCTAEGKGEGVACSVCGLQMTVPAVVPRTAHDYLFGSCRICGTTEIDHSDIRLYRSELGYTFFETAEHGEGMRGLYDEMTETLSSFHASETENASFYAANDALGDLYLVSSFDYAKHGLSLEEAQTVYAVLRMDNPIFYWMSYWLYWTDSTIYITTTADYASAADRAQYSAQIYAGIAEIAECAQGDTSAYEVALTYYEEIATRAEYAYNENGETEDAMWAHSIAGLFTHGKMVCEGYGKLLQILLNLSGIENVYISGDANGSHVWNAAKMDDGNWYWIDITWGDGEPIYYSYFCVLESSLDSHTPTEPNTLGLYFNAPLPECATEPFKHDNIFEIGEYVIIDGREYVRNTKHTVKGTVSATGFPEEIEHLGRIYKVIQ